MKFSNYKKHLSTAHWTGMRTLLNLARKDPTIAHRIIDGEEPEALAALMRAASDSFAETNAKQLIDDDTEL